MTRTVLRGAREPGDIAIVDGHITAIGTLGAVPGDVVIDCDDNIITAGLINTHHHLYQWMTRGRAIGCDLFGWLTELYPVWGELDVEDVSAAATVGLGELALTGCTTAFDHHYLVPQGDDTVFDAIVEAACGRRPAPPLPRLDGSRRVPWWTAARSRRGGHRRHPGLHRAHHRRAP